MSKEHLTNTGIKNRKPKEKDYTITDSSGMWLRVYPNGRKVFCWRYRDNHRKCPKTKNAPLSRVEYGDYPDRNLEHARQIHSKAKTARSNGYDLKDPEVLNEIIKEVVKDSPDFIKSEDAEVVYTVDNLIDDYWSDYIEKENIGQRPYRRIKKHIRPVMGDYPVDGIPDKEIEDLIKAQREAGEKDRTTYDTMRFGSSMYRWGIENFKCKTNPFQKFSNCSKLTGKSTFTGQRKLS